MVPFDLINASFKILQAKCKVARIFNKFAADHFESLWTLNLLPCNVSDESALRAMKNNLWRCWFQVKFPEMLKVCAVYVLDSTVYHGSKKNTCVYIPNVKINICKLDIYSIYSLWCKYLYIYIHTLYVLFLASSATQLRQSKNWDCAADRASFRRWAENGGTRHAGSQPSGVAWTAVDARIPASSWY